MCNVYECECEDEYVYEHMHICVHVYKDEKGVSGVTIYLSCER